MLEFAETTYHGVERQGGGVDSSLDGLQFVGVSICLEGASRHVESGWSNLDGAGAELGEKAQHLSPALAVKVASGVDQVARVGKGITLVQLPLLADGAVLHRDGQQRKPLSSSSLSPYPRIPCEVGMGCFVSD